MVESLSLFERLSSTLKAKIAEISARRDVSPNVVKAINEEVARIVESEKASYVAEVSELRKSIGLLEAERGRLQAESETLRSSLNRLLEENAKLKERVAVLEEKRPKYSPTQLTMSLKDAMERMQEGLETPEESRLDYTISEFAIDLKANVGLGEDHKVLIQTPELSEEVPPQNLSTLHLSLKTIPKLKAERLAVTVPNLIGKRKEAAIKIIEEAGLKLESVVKRVSRTPAGIVIDQDPEPYGRASPGFPVTLIVAKEEGVEVPTLVGVSRENAEKLLKDAGLKLGKVTEQPVKAKPGLVLSQSIEPGIKVKEGTPVDLTISKLPVVKVPNLINKDRKTAVKEITDAGLKVSISRRRVPRAARDTVVEQDPAPDTEVPVGTTVKIVVPQSRREA